MMLHMPRATAGAWLAAGELAHLERQSCNPKKGVDGKERLQIADDR